MFLARGMIHCRMYGTWEAFRRGWKRIYTESANRKPGRMRVQGGRVGVLIECGTNDVYEQIAFVKFAPEWLKTRKAPEAKPVTKQ